MPHDDIRSPYARAMVIHWWEDSSGRRTCHINGQPIGFEESFLGEIRGNDLNGWFYRLKDTKEWVGPSKHMQNVMRALEVAVGGVVIDTSN